MIIKDREKKTIMPEVIKAVMKKNRIITKRAYPWSFIISRVSGAIFALVGPVLLYYFVFEKNMSKMYELSTNNFNYLQYIVIGEVLNTLSFSTLMGVGRCLITEQREGTLETILITPMSRNGYYLGVYFEQFVRSLIESLSILVVGLMIGARIPLKIVPNVLLAICLSSVAFFSVAILVSSVMIYTRDTYLVQNTLYILMSCICGVAYPVEYLPTIMRYIANCFPLTYAINITRNCVNGVEAIKIKDVVLLMLLSIIYYIVGFYSFKIQEKKLIEQVLA